VTLPCGVCRTCVPVRAMAVRGRATGPVGYLLAGFALACFGFFGVLAFLSTGASMSSLAGRQRGRSYDSSGMISVPIRSSCSRSSPFIR